MYSCTVVECAIHTTLGITTLVSNPCLTCNLVSDLLSSSSVSKQRVGRRVWLESSFLPAKTSRGGGMEGGSGEGVDAGAFRLEDQIF